jgi:3-keto-L-gulonate-6-phosphate decarboxylase
VIPNPESVDLDRIAVQVSLDVTTLNEALSMARGAVRAGVDWPEAGKVRVA